MKLYFKYAVVTAIMGAVLASCASDPNIESAKLNLRNADYEGVIESAEKALVENPENADAYFYIGAAHLEIAEDKPVSERRENLRKARESMVKADELYKAQDISSNEAESAINLLIARWSDEYSQAVEGIDFEQENPPELLQNSLDHLYNAYEVMPDSAMNLDALSEIYFMMDNVDKAAEYMERAIDLSDEPDLSRYQRLTYFYSVKDDIDGSLSILERAAERFPDEIFFVQEQANIYFRTGQIREAMEILEDLIATDPENPQYRLVFGSQIYQEYLNLTDEVSDLYEQLFDLNSQFREEARRSQPDLSKIEDLENRIDTIQDRITEVDAQRFEIAEESERQLLIAFELESDNPATTYTLGAINENRGLALIDQVNNMYDEDMDEEGMRERARNYFESAVTFYEKTAELEPEEADNWLKLFQLYTRLGMEAEAEEAAEKAGI